MADLRVALIGYGLAGRVFHAPLIAATPGLDLTTVVTANPERRSQVGQEHPRTSVVDDAVQLWKAPRHDLVVIATPNLTHGPLAREAIARGIPAVVDKPLAVTSQEAEEVVAEAERARVLLTVFQNRRWDSDHLTLARLIAEGHLGDVLRYESRFERWRPVANTDEWRSAAPEAGGGQLLDLGSHLVDQALCLFGPVTHVYAELAAERGLDADDDAFLALRHRAGTISHLRASAMTAAPGPRLRVLGTKAALVIRELDSQESRLRAGRRPDDGDWGVEPETAWGHLEAGDDEEKVVSEAGDWPRFYALLASALRNGGRPPVDPHDAVETLRVLEQARRSADTRSVVAVARPAG